MPRMTAEMQARFLEQPFIGVLASLRQDGRPYTVPVWWLHRDGAFWITGTYSRVWCKQLMHDPRASLCIEASGEMAGHIDVDGNATALERPDLDIWPVSRALAEKYVGRGDPGRAEAVERFFANMQTEPRLLFRLDPEVWRAIDMTVYEGKRADREHQARVRAGEGAEG
jgi:nitroimidazol reductase NimA-like FMN-containing flavoprotein (pyridoxamine 5'-phosphate oxidase superfamily)